MQIQPTQKAARLICGVWQEQANKDEDGVKVCSLIQIFTTLLKADHHLLE